MNENDNPILISLEKEIKAPDTTVVECPKEDSCKLINDFLESPSILKASEAFLLSYDKMDKTKFETEESYKNIFKEIKEACDKGEFMIYSDYMLPHAFLKYLKDIGYGIYSYSSNPQHYSIGTTIRWDNSFINGN